MKKAIIEISIDDISVGKKYFDFRYTIHVNGIIHQDGIISDDHSWESPDEFLKCLESGYGIQLVLEQMEF